jgi:hypothetical protein
MTAITSLMTIASPALAFGDTKPEGAGILLYLFFGFGFLIMVFQLIPGLILFRALVKALFEQSTTEKEPATVR